MIKLGHFMPIKGCLLEISVAEILSVVVIFRPVSDAIEKLIDSSPPIIEPKVIDNISSFFFEIIRNKKEIFSERKYKNNKKYWLLYSFAINNGYKL